MNPIYFGSTKNALYGVLHPPRGTAARSTGVVLCYPFAQEYMRAHRAFRQMALLLSGEGFHTIRFDYSGTGDSAGGPDEMSLENWNRDLGYAIDELVDTAALDSVWLVGLRLGAAVALRGTTRSDVAGVVLWDPIMTGAAQLEDAATERDGSGKPVLAIGGVPISADFRDDLLSIDMLQMPVRPGLPHLLAVSADLPQYQSLRDRLAREGADASYTCVPSDGRWSLYDNWGSALIPQALVRAIVDHLKRTAK